MSRTEVVRIRRPESVADDVASLNERIMRRAYQGRIQEWDPENPGPGEQRSSRQEDRDQRRIVFASPNGIRGQARQSPIIQ